MARGMSEAGRYPSSLSLKAAFRMDATNGFPPPARVGPLWHFRSPYRFSKASSGVATEELRRNFWKC